MSKDTSKKSDLKKLEKLEIEVKDLKDDYKHNKKLLVESGVIRNLKIFKSVVSLSMPFLAACTVFTSTSFYLGTGLPVIKDKEKNYKKCVYECEDDTIVITESYDGGSKRNYNYGKTDFNVSFKWHEKDGKYERKVRTYSEKNLSDIELFDAVKDGNIEYIDLNYVSVKEKIEETNNPSVLDDNRVRIEGIVTCIDKDNYLSIEESDKKNWFATLLILLLSTTVSITANKNRKKKIKENVKHYIKEHKDFKNLVSLEYRKIKDKENKIKSLSKWVNK